MTHFAAAAVAEPGVAKRMRMGKQAEFAVILNKNPCSRAFEPASCRGPTARPGGSLDRELLEQAAGAAFRTLRAAVPSCRTARRGLSAIAND